MLQLNKIFFFVFLTLYFNYSAQNDSVFHSKKMWNSAVEISCDNYIFQERMPYYRNRFSAGVTGNFCLIKTFRENENKTFVLRIGFGYVQYNLKVPDLNHFFGVSSPTGQAQLYYPFDSCSYKTVSLKYFNIPVSYAFNFRQQHKFAWGIGGELNFLNMPRSFVINESYTFKYSIPSKGPPFFQSATQVNQLIYNKNVILPKTALYFNYRFKNSNVLLKLSKCLVGEIYRQNFYVDKNDYDYKYGNAYYNGSGGWNTINLYRVIYSGIGLSLMYQYVF